tara:strand:+ start:1 stop:1269 length:1269 start_codon:yes stop_codon:yes gene_type:complete
MLPEITKQIFKYKNSLKKTSGNLVELQNAKLFLKDHLKTINKNPGIVDRLPNKTILKMVEEIGTKSLETEEKTIPWTIETIPGLGKTVTAVKKDAKGNIIDIKTVKKDPNFEPIQHNNKGMFLDKQVRDEFPNFVPKPGIQYWWNKNKNTIEQFPSKSGVTVNIDKGKERMQDKKMWNSSFINTIDNFEKEAESQRNLLNVYNQMKVYMTQINTNKWEEVKTNFGRYMKPLTDQLLGGEWFPDQGMKESFQALGIKLSMEAVKLTKGSVSNKEMELFALMYPALKNSKEGNLILIEFLSNASRQSIEMGKWIEQEKARNYKIDGVMRVDYAKFVKAKEEIRNKYPVVSKSLLNRIAQNKKIIIEKTGDRSSFYFDAFRKLRGYGARVARWKFEGEMNGVPIIKVFFKNNTTEMLTYVPDRDK